MYKNELELKTVEATETAISREERYELIAMIAQKFNTAKASHVDEDELTWESSDVELDFDEIVYHYN